MGRFATLFSLAALFVIGVAALAPPANAQQAPQHLRVVVTDTRGKDNTYGDEVQKLELVLGKDDQIAFVHLVLRQSPAVYAVTHVWYPVQNIIGIEYQPLSPTGQGRIFYIRTLQLPVQPQIVDAGRSPAGPQPQ